MPLVRILKQWGFEQVGDIVDYRGVDLNQRVAAGEVELLTADPRPVVSWAAGAEQSAAKAAEEVAAEKLAEIEKELEEVKAEVEGN